MSDSSDDEGPQVVKFTGGSTVPIVSKREKKRYMSSTAPKEAREATPSRRNGGGKAEDDDDDDDLKKDTALQRLLDESHILSEANKYSGADISNIDFDPVGKTRHKTLDRRLDQLGVKGTGKKGQMPMGMAKGIKQAQMDRKKKSIEHAKDAGIILARSQSKIDKKKPEKRQRGLQIQSIGKSTKHGLVVSDREIQKYSRKKR